MAELPGRFRELRVRYPDVMDAVDAVGRTVREAGPIDEKHVHLIQLAAAAAIRSEGAVHSHARRAHEAGASREEIEHALVLLTSTIGYPTVAAALSWIDDDRGHRDASRG